MIKIAVAKIDNQKMLNDIANRKHGRNKKRCMSCGKARTLECEMCDNYDNRAIMKSVIPYIVKRYEFFETNIRNLNKVKEENKIVGHAKDLLIESYEKSSDFKMARKKIYDGMPQAIKAKCPFCMISAPNTLDHYFDKDGYPEFAVYTPNLIPCCSQCNSKKGTQIFLPNGERKVLHYYFDEIPKYQFLYMTIELKEYIPVINILLKLDEEKENDRIIENQFTNLNLVERYKDQLNDQLSTIVEEFAEYYHQGKDIQGIIDMIIIRMQAYRKNNGVNYWVACLYDCLIKNPYTLETMLKIA